MLKQFCFHSLPGKKMTLVAPTLGKKKDRIQAGQVTTMMIR
jgi:hypothetical protein